MSSCGHMPKFSALTVLPVNCGRYAGLRAPVAGITACEGHLPPWVKLSGAFAKVGREVNIFQEVNI